MSPLKSLRVNIMKNAMYGVVVSYYTFSFVGTLHFMVVTLIPYIIKFLKENSHLIVILRSLKNTLSRIGKEWSSVSKAAKDLIKRML